MSVAACTETVLSLVLPRLGYLPHLPGDAVFHWPTVTDPIVMVAMSLALAYAIVRIRREILEGVPPGQPLGASAEPPAATACVPARPFGLRRDDGPERTAVILPFRARRGEAPALDRAIAA